jgi:1-aminocyclopropane-1-carboxylate deaminase/D-cysteine desulfhydrase-like pyridoxal-dependent ACC family enzyme
MPIATTAPITAALARLRSMPVAEFGAAPTLVEELAGFRAAAGLEQRILTKRDDAIPFAFGGNKVRKLRYVIPRLLADGTDTVITCGGVQSNHARATAAACAVSGLACHIVANGERPDRPRGNALLNELLGATIEYVASREDRAPAMQRSLDRLRADGRRPAIVPLGASTPLGALGFAAAVAELLGQVEPPEVIVHACSSGGTTAGLVAGCVLHGVATRVVGISADDPPDAVRAAVTGILEGMGDMLGVDRLADRGADRFEVDDAFVGDGYGVPSPASVEAQGLAIRSAGMFTDHTYTAKALAGLVAWCRDGRIPARNTVLFWHTGGQVALFA